MNRGVLLYGPPAVGKDTVTGELERRGPFVHFRRLKAGPGRTTGYRMISDATLRSLPASDLLYMNRRYGSTYIVDRTGLDHLWHSGRVPVVHLGQPDAVRTLVERTPGTRWLVVELRSPLSVLTERIIRRATGDEAARVSAARNTPPLDHPDLMIDTSEISPEQAAELISQNLIASRF